MMMELGGVYIVSAVFPLYSGDMWYSSLTRKMKHFFYTQKRLDESSMMCYHYRATEK